MKKFVCLLLALMLLPLCAPAEDVWVDSEPQEIVPGTLYVYADDDDSSAQSTAKSGPRVDPENDSWPK